MTYYNLVFRAGDERFAASLADAGVAGIILPDVPMEEQGAWSAAADAHGIDTVLLAGRRSRPTTGLRAVCRRAEASSTASPSWASPASARRSAKRRPRWPAG